MAKKLAVGICVIKIRKQLINIILIPIIGSESIFEKCNLFAKNM
jgi:hypothetical protein